MSRHVAIAAALLGCTIIPSSAQDADHPPIPITFTLDEAGIVTLVIDDANGNRVRNLVSETPFPAGENTVWWDGADDQERIQTSINSNFEVTPRQVEPGSYTVRGLVRPEIELRYEFTVYNPGKPPWASASPSGEWLANHSPPSGTLFVPEADAATSPAGETPGGLVLVCSFVAEGGSGLAWLDLDGVKRYGQHWIGGVWTGATHLARDTGPERVEGVYAYTGATWKADEGGGYDGPKSELRLAELLTTDARSGAPRDTRFGQGFDRPLLAPFAPNQGILPNGVESLAQPGEDTRYAFPDAEHTGLSGLAIHNAALVAALPYMDKLLWVDAAARKIIGTVPMEDPRGLAFDSAGRLLCLSGTRLLRFTLTGDVLNLPPPEVLVREGLEDPIGITTDDEGRIYISDRGDSNQVKVFAEDGALSHTIGKPGLPKLGPYDPECMHNPNGITIDERGRLWVAETDTAPKRVSVWERDGEFARAFYGPMEYGGGGAIDPEDPTRFYYAGIEFSLDWETGESAPSSIYYEPRYDKLGLASQFRSRAPEAAIYHDGRRYLTDCYVVSPTDCARSAALWLLEDGIARPVAAMGNASAWDRAKELFPEAMEAGEPQAFCWTDLNDDGDVQPEEAILVPGNTNGVTVMPDLSFVVEYFDGRAMRFAPVQFTDKGTPVYDIAAGEELASGTRAPYTSGGGQALVFDDGWTLLTVPPEPFTPQGAVAGVSADGSIWTYPNCWPGLHPSHDAPLPQRPGELIGTTRLLGGALRPRGSDIGNIWAVNGNKGNAYVFTSDGLFVATLFRDCRTTSWNAPSADRGMLVSDLSQNEENFWPSMTQTADGDIFMVTGGNGGSIIRVEGLERARRLATQAIDVTPDQLLTAQAWRMERERERHEQAEEGPLTVAIPQAAPAVDGQLTEWDEARFVPVDARASGAIAISGDRLYAAFRTGDGRLLANSGESLALLFKSGGALNIEVDSMPGGVRLLVAQVEGRTTAVLYAPEDPSATGESVPFSSPMRTITFARVDDVSDQVELAADGAGNYELSVPLTALSLEPVEGGATRGDIGVLRGNGYQTLQRVNWSNKATGITADIPSEAELRPDLWGIWEFRAGTE